MKKYLAGALAITAAAVVQAADSDDGIRYVPEIFGHLAGAHGYTPTNVCLRQSGSEITQCAYTDPDGRFRIPSFGEVHPQPATVGDKRASGYPEYWLELGTRTDVVTRLHGVDLVSRKRVAIHLDCDVARSSPDRCANAGTRDEHR